MIYEAEVISMIALGGRLVSRDPLSQAGLAEGEPHMFNPGWGPTSSRDSRAGGGGEETLPPRDLAAPPPHGSLRDTLPSLFSLSF